MTTPKNGTTKPALQHETMQRLRELLPQACTKSRTGARGMTLTYIPTNIAIAVANEIFGHGGWSKTVRNIEIDKNEQGQTIGYSAVISLHIHENGTVYEDIGYSAMNERNVATRGKPADRQLIQDADEHSRARKSAISDGLKRCLRHAGDMFGNNLYEKEDDRRRLANAAIDAWLEAGYDDNEAYDKVVLPHRRTTDVPAATSLANINKANQYRAEKNEDRS